MDYSGALDSAFGPTLTVAQQARVAGILAWLGYLGGPGAFHQWRPDEWAVIRQAGLRPGALWVPTTGLAEDPTIAAHQAILVANSLGLFGAIMLDTERAMLDTAGPARVKYFVDGFYKTVVSIGRPCPIYKGAQYAPAGAPTFDPLWGSANNPTTGQAVQYGPAVRFGMSVDVDLIGSGFPLGSWTPPKPTPTPPPTPDPGDDVTPQDKQDIINGVLAGMRSLFAPPGGELYGRVIQADNQSIEEEAGTIAQAVVAAEKPTS